MAQEQDRVQGQGLALESVQGQDLALESVQGQGLALESDQVQEELQSPPHQSLKLLAGVYQVSYFTSKARLHSTAFPS